MFNVLSFQFFLSLIMISEFLTMNLSFHMLGLHGYLCVCTCVYRGVGRHLVLSTFEWPRL